MTGNDFHDLASAFVTLLVVVEPLGLAPIFLATTARHSEPSRARIAVRACIYAFTILAGAAFGGERLLSAVGISLPAFHIAGGMLLFSLASEMVLGVRIRREAYAAARAVEENGRHIAAFPLAIPLMAGPGAITATLLLAGQARSDPTKLAALILSIAAVMLICYLVCRLAVRVERIFGTSANIVVAKLLGVLLAALAVQFVLDGVRALLRG
ncbi:MAG TPA: MarC family protein [Methylocystis sp.]|jgi:multiple antibiotic resistance protein